MITYNTIAQLVAGAQHTKQSIAAVVWQAEAKHSERSEQAVWDDMAGRLLVMRQAVKQGLTMSERSHNGLVGGDAFRLVQGHNFIGDIMLNTIAYAIAVSEVNADMGRIVACPTAGACGIVPGAILAVGESVGSTEEQLVRALFAAAGVGEVIAANATIAGAVGGCQAECGTAAAMAAVAVTELLGGAPAQAAHALALALKNMLGLVCDPVAGLVEVPCVKRNGFAAAHALTAAQLALSGVESLIPADEVIDAMRRIGLELPSSLKETAQGGLALTPTALAVAARLA